MTTGKQVLIIYINPARRPLPGLQTSTFFQSWIEGTEEFHPGRSTTLPRIIEEYYSVPRAPTWEKCETSLGLNFGTPCLQSKCTFDLANQPAIYIFHQTG